MTAIKYAEEAEEGQGQLEMANANYDFIQKHLSELALQVVHIVQVGNKGKEILEDELKSVKANIEILESRIDTDKQRVDKEVAGVGSHMQLQEAVLQEIRSGVNILQAQDNQIVQVANSIFEAFKNQLEAISTRVTNCDSQLLYIKGTNIGIQRSLKDVNSMIVKVNEILDTIRNSLKGSPSQRALGQHASVMEDQLARYTELNTGLTTAMEG
jgi:predicted  nucleic acid-binding Zn-ribbon protein